MMDASSIGMSVDMGQWVSRDAIGGSGRGPATTVGHLETALVLVDGDEVTTEIVFTRKGSTTVGVVACVWLESVGVVRGHVRLEIERACKGCNQPTSDDHQ
jgi:hypothetical protein